MSYRFRKYVGTLVTFLAMFDVIKKKIAQTKNPEKAILEYYKIMMALPAFFYGCELWVLTRENISSISGRNI